MTTKKKPKAPAVPLPEAVINAEKAGKPRPDLLPAFGLLNASTSDDAPDALVNLWIFRRDMNLGALGEAIGIVADQLGGWPAALEAGGRVMAYGYRKHGNCTWRVASTEQADPQTHVASAERHLIEHWADPAATEAGSGLPVLEHAFSQLLILFDLVLDPPAVPNKNDGHGTVTGRVADAHR